MASTVVTKLLFPHRYQEKTAEKGALSGKITGKMDSLLLLTATLLYFHLVGFFVCFVLVRVSVTFS